MKIAGEKVTGGTGEFVSRAEVRTERALTVLVSVKVASDKTERAFVEGNCGANDNKADVRTDRALREPVLGELDRAASRHSPAQSVGVTVT